jgi:hypothetical protein
MMNAVMIRAPEVASTSGRTRRLAIARLRVHGYGLIPLGVQCAESLARTRVAPRAKP